MPSQTSANPQLQNGQINSRIEPQLFRLRTQLLSQGRSDYTLASTDLMSIRIKCYAIISSDVVGHYKPDDQFYQKALTLLSLDSSQILHVACHKFDLESAKKLGFNTCFIPRPDENGPGSVKASEMQPEDYMDIYASSFEELALFLGV